MYIVHYAQFLNEIVLKQKFAIDQGYNFNLEIFWLHVQVRVKHTQRKINKINVNSEVLGKRKQNWI